MSSWPVQPLLIVNVTLAVPLWVAPWSAPWPVIVAAPLHVPPLPVPVQGVPLAVAPFGSLRIHRLRSDITHRQASKLNGPSTPICGSCHSVQPVRSGYVPCWPRPGGRDSSRTDDSAPARRGRPLEVAAASRGCGSTLGRANVPHDTFNTP